MSHFDELVTADLTTLVAWLEYENPQVALLGPQQWLALVELITAQLTDTPVSARVDWQRASNAYFRCLSLAERSGVLNELDMTIRSLNLTSVLLQKLGAQVSVRLLDPQEAISSFFRQVPVPLPEARELSNNWQAIDVADIRRLRAAKNLLTPALRLKPFIENEQTLSELDDWEAIYPKLP